MSCLLRIDDVIVMSDQVFMSQISYRGIHIYHIYYRATFECFSFLVYKYKGGGGGG